MVKVKAFYCFCSLFSIDLKNIIDERVKVGYNLLETGRHSEPWYKLNLCQEDEIKAHWNKMKTHWTKAKTH